MPSHNKLEILESIRGFAALYVVVHHLGLRKYSVFGHLLSQGQAAVMLFFVVSGFVMYYANHKSKAEGRLVWKAYFVKRFRRIYPVFIAALGISYIMACLEQEVFPLPIQFEALLGNLFNLQDLNRIPGTMIRPYYDNSPLWSLSYEWWFYLMFFPIFKYFNAKQQRSIALIISLTGFFFYQVYPSKVFITLEYFIIWWSGVEIARSWVNEGKVSRNTIYYLTISLGLMLLLTAIPVALLFIQGSEVSPKDHPIIEFRHFVYTVSIIAFGILWKRYAFVGYKTILKPFIVFAPVSYGVYVFHMPLMHKLHVFEYTWLNYLIGFIITIIISYVLEVKIQSYINKWTQVFVKTKVST